MELLAAISFLATVLSGLLVGGRLLALARQTGRAPELFLGLATLLLALAAVAEVSALELHGHEVAGAYPVEVLACIRTCVLFIFHEPSAFLVIGSCGSKRGSRVGSSAMNQVSPPDLVG